MAGKIEVLSPVGTHIPTPQPLVRRLDALEGKVIGLIDNNKPGSRQILEAIREGLAAYNVRDFVYSRKAHPAEGSPYVAELATRVDAAVGAIGD
jgi:hypothetical protein